MSEPVVPYHERLPDLERELTERGSLGVVVLDASPLATIEDRYGTAAHEEVTHRIFKILDEARGAKEGGYRQEDVVCLDRPRGLRILFFLDRKRRRTVPLSVADLRTARQRVASSLVPKLVRASIPYLKKAPSPDVGYGLALNNPLLHAGRSIERAIEEGLSMAAYLRQTEELAVRERLQDILLRERVRTDYQAIFRMQEGTIMGFEALSRGPRGSGLEQAKLLFDAAQEHNLSIEMDRLCRRRALLSSGRVPSSAKIFINTLPATLRDPQFRDKALIEFLDKAQVKPERIVVEITEHDAIENFDMFLDTMGYFTSLGMSFAVDDVGAGYAGLDMVVRLKPRYLKIDMGLVRDVHASEFNRRMVKDLIALGHGIGAEVLAEGIQREEEAQVLRGIGVDYGQGYHLAKPDPGPEPV
jgi:EAL domain-containing protein (putative c-di-GMP-specific phosphodiesterase class I)